VETHTGLQRCHNCKRPTQKSLEIKKKKFCGHAGWLDGWLGEGVVLARDCGGLDRCWKGDQKGLPLITLAEGATEGHRREQEQIRQGGEYPMARSGG